MENRKLQEPLICAIVCRLDRAARVAFIKPDHKSLWAFVGGPIELTYIGPGIELIAGKESESAKPFNREVPAFARPLPEDFQPESVVTLDADLLEDGSGKLGVHRVYGNFLICGANATSLPASFAVPFAELLNRGKR